MSQQITLNPESETPEQLEARTKLEAEMIAKGEGVDIRHHNKSTGQTIKHTASTEGELPTRPDNVPEKFWDEKTGEVNLEALLKSQADGAAEVSRLQQAKTPEVVGAELLAAEKLAKERSGTEQPKGTDSATAIQAAREEYEKNNSLSSTTYETLAKAGLDRSMVDGWIAGVQTKQAELTKATYDATGGEENFGIMSEWASSNMDAGKVAAINTLLASSDPQVVAQGAAQLKENYAANADIDPDVIISGGGGRSPSGAYFKSKFEMTSAMSDKRYSKDAGFRAEVAEKIMRSGVLKINLFM